MNKEQATVGRSTKNCTIRLLHLAHVQRPTADNLFT